MNISFLGAGRMCKAIINGILTSNFAESGDIKIYDVDESVYREYKKIGVYGAADIGDAVSFADYIFLAVKPQNADTVLGWLEPYKDILNGKIFVSIITGISTSYIESRLGIQPGIARVMPNTPMLIGRGAAAICRNNTISDGEFEYVCNMFQTLGCVSVLDESVMTNVTCVNGSGPAYIYLFAKAMCDEAVSQGIEYGEAMKLTTATMIGSLLMLEESGKTPEELIAEVTSPGGTTLAALESFRENGFERAISEAMKACTKRANELAK